MISSPNRAVVLATPLIFAPLAGAVTAWAAQHAPGVNIEGGQLEAIFIAGATIGFGKAALWLKGWQDHEKRQELVPGDALESANDIGLAGDGEDDLDGDIELADSEMDDDVEDEDPDDVLASLEAALGDEPDAVHAEEV